MSGAPDLDQLAAEHAVGILEGEAAARAAALMESDPAFARAVEEWRERLQELDEIVERPQPSPALWERIAADFQAGAPASVLEFRPASERRRGVPGGLAAWRAATAAAVAAALLLAAGLAYFADKASRTPVLVAVLLDETDASPAAIVSAFADGRTDLVPLRSVDVPPGKALEVWTLWDRSVGPRSVGLIDRARSTRLDLAALPRPEANQLFEITLEPASGSPTGRPTGPILMKGLTATAR